MHFIRRDASATYKLKTCYRYFTDKTSRTNLIYQTNLIRFRRRAIVEFNCSWDLELNSSELRAAACKNREPHFTDHLVEFLIFRLKITLDELFSKIIF